MLARITFPYLVLISLVTLFAGMLNSLLALRARRRRADPAQPGADRGAAGCAEQRDRQRSPRRTGAWRLAVTGRGRAAAGLAVAGLRARTGFRLRLRRPRLTPEVKRLGMLILPATFGGGRSTRSAGVSTRSSPRPAAARLAHLLKHGRPAEPVAAGHHRHRARHRDPADALAPHRRGDERRRRCGRRPTRSSWRCC